MKLTAKTIDILKYFSTISPSILIREGNIIRARNVPKTLFIKAELEEAFPLEFYMSSIPEFLKTINLFNEPEIEFNEKNMIIHEGSLKVRYMYSEMDLCIDPPQNQDYNPENVNWNMNFVMAKQELDNIQKVSRVLNLDTISFTNSEIEVYNHKVRDKNNFKTSYTETMTTTGEVPESYEINFKTEYLDLYPGNYDLDFYCSKRTCVKMTNQEDKVTVWAAANPSSSV